MTQEKLLEKRLCRWKHNLTTCLTCVHWKALFYQYTPPHWKPQRHRTSFYLPYFTFTFLKLLHVDGYIKWKRRHLSGLSIHPSCFPLSPIGGWWLLEPNPTHAGWRQDAPETVCSRSQDSMISFRVKAINCVLLCLYCSLKEKHKRLLFKTKCIFQSWECYWTGLLGIAVASKRVKRSQSDTNHTRMQLEHKSV